MKKLITLTFVLTLMGCASKPEYVRPNYKTFINEHDLKSVSKIHHFRMVRWQTLDDRYFILHASKNRDYLIQLMGHCQDLSLALTLKLNQSMRLTLQSKFDSITHDRYPGRSCGIRNIYELTPEQKKALTQKDKIKGSVEVEKGS